jgi:hypothetical protein
MVKKVKVIEIHSKEVLFETQIENIEKAYTFASDMEKMGVEVQIEAPTITETLTDSLGLGLDDKYMYEQSVEDEIHDHDGSCCAKPNEPIH